jgi:chromosome segregation protein
MLGEEESKLKDVRSFNTNILKEKEEIIRKELEKNLEIANLENALSDIQHSLQQEEAARNKIKADYDELKEQSKRYGHQLKELEITLQAEKNKYTEIRDKLREKEQSLSELRDEAATLKRKLEESAQKHKAVVEELQ